MGFHGHCVFSGCTSISLMWFTLRPAAKWLLSAVQALMASGLSSLPLSLSNTHTLAPIHIHTTVMVFACKRERLDRQAYGWNISSCIPFIHFDITDICLRLFCIKHNKLCVRQTSRQADWLTCVLFSFLPQISGSMNLGLGCVYRPVCWPFGSVLDSRHCVFALTLLTLLMQVVVEANSWWYAFFSPYVQYFCVCLYLCTVCFCVCVYLWYGQWRLSDRKDMQKRQRFRVILISKKIYFLILYLSFT